MLRFLLRLQLRGAERTRLWIAVEEDQERRAQHTSRTGPAWLVQMGLTGGRPLAVTWGTALTGARLRGGRSSRDEALRVLADQVEACTMRCPDRELGVL
ncbi:hypothetical protein [Streptomyces lavendofoliae]|uniref:hypothetical protein n=1 Tax=Streptomyces lavendofoliae TaxID=67314 RepID=UPI003D8C8E4C